MNIELPPLVALLFFPGGLFLLFSGMVYEWADRKLVAQFQNRIGPRWFQPVADVVKLLAKEEIVPDGVNPVLFHGLPVVALVGTLTAALYVPMAGLAPVLQLHRRPDRHALPAQPDDAVHGTGRRQHDRPLLAGRRHARADAAVLLRGAVPAGAARPGHRRRHLAASAEVDVYAHGHWWLVLTQPIGFLVALVGLMGKLELPPFDSPEAETEIVAGPMTEYSGRGWALFRIGRDVELFVGLTLMASFYLGGMANPIEFVLKTGGAAGRDGRRCSRCSAACASTRRSGCGGGSASCCALAQLFLLVLSR